MITIFCSPSPCLANSASVQGIGLWLAGQTTTVSSLAWVWSGAEPNLWAYLYSSDGGATWSRNAAGATGARTADIPYVTGLVQVYGMAIVDGPAVTDYSNVIDLAPVVNGFTDGSGNLFTDGNGNIFTP